MWTTKLCLPVTVRVEHLVALELLQLLLLGDRLHDAALELGLLLLKGERHPGGAFVLVRVGLVVILVAVVALVVPR